MAQASPAGMSAALYTCYRDDGGVNVDETVRLATWLIDSGLHGLYLCGSTGDGLLLTVEDRKTISRAVSDAVGDRADLIIHVGAMATADSVALAEHAASLGTVKGISALPPLYYQLPLERWVAHWATVSGAAALPFYPYLRGDMIAGHGRQALLDAFARLPHMGGVKAYIQGLAQEAAMLADWPAEWNFFHAADDTLAQALALEGVCGAIGSTYNILPELALTIWRRTRESDFAGAFALQRRLTGYFLATQPHDLVCTGRRLLEVRGFALGDARLPRYAPAKDDMPGVMAALERRGIDVRNGGLGE